MLKPEYTNQFKKDYKRVQKRGLKMELLKIVIESICIERPLPDKCRDHFLSGDYASYRECHIMPDWLLIYQIGDGMVVFTRTGSHSDLFG